MNTNPRRLTGKTQEIECAGIAESSPKEIEAALGEKTYVELLEIASNLQGERLDSDAAIVYRFILEGKDFTSPQKGNAIRRLGSIMMRTEPEEFEELLEETLATNEKDWQIATSVAEAYDNLSGQRYFHNGVYSFSYVGGSERYIAYERIRVRQLQILRDALPLVRADLAADLENNAEPAKSFYQTFIRILERRYWQRQTLTNLDELPDYEPADLFRTRRGYQLAPVDESGEPVFFHAPTSFEDAVNDGERVQALREELVRLIPSTASDVFFLRASEAQALFGVETLANLQFFSAEEKESANAGIWSLTSLKDSETIARLATGIKRFELPEDHDYIALYHNAIETSTNLRVDAWKALAQEYESRRQFVKAAETWRGLVSALETEMKNNGASWYRSELREAKNALSQIVDPRVRFDQASSKVFGKKTTLVVRSRNTEGAKITIRELKIDALLKQFEDKSFQRDRYETVESRIHSLLLAAGIGEPIDDDDEKRLKDLRVPKGGFIGDVVATIETPIEKLEGHNDTFTTVDLPELTPGAYLVDGLANGGDEDSTDYVVIWPREVAIVKKPVEGGVRYFLLDAETGAPRKDAKLEITTITRTYDDKSTEEKVSVKKKSESVDENGSTFVKNDGERSRNVQTLTVAKTVDATTKKTLYSVFDIDGIWSPIKPNPVFEKRCAFFVSDRPIYRPGQKVEFKFWVGSPRYDAPDDVNEWAGKTIAYKISSPLNQVLVVKKEVVLDQFGAFADSFEISEKAGLGVYQIQIGSGLNANNSLYDVYGGGSFRVEEYRKPEYKVTVDAPKEPIQLGDSFKATVRADYYFGAPVSGAKVSYKVTRQNFRSAWYPQRYWDWFYGVGYWQFPYDAPWYPGWSRWGCPRLIPSRMFIDTPGSVPEVVSEGEGTLNEDGTFEIAIDSSLAKLLYPKDDQTYEIEAEVVDDSRRTIVGKGKVYAARNPFTTTVWFDRGFYKTQEKMTASFQARRIDGKPVLGDAVVKLYKVRYEGEASEYELVKPIEEEVFTAAVKTDDKGCGKVDMTAAEPGQYRLSCVVTTAEGLQQEGGQLILVEGVQETNEPTAKGDYRFNRLEIIPDKAEYAVGETARIQITSNRHDAFVVLFLRTVNGIADNNPIYLKLSNGVGYYDLPIESSDQPNVFIEASTVFNGIFSTELKELAVPPAKRVLDVAVTPEKERVKPGEKAKLRVKLTDLDGRPIVGQTVVAVYDESLDALAGGSNVADVRDFFWKWRRFSTTKISSNLFMSVFFDVFAEMNDNQNWNKRLQGIGVFGNTTVSISGETFFTGAPRLRAMGLKGGAMLNEASEAVAMDSAPAPAPRMAAAPKMMALNAGPKEAMSVGTNQIADDAETPLMSETGAGEVEFADPTVRKNLADVAYWAADLVADDNGEIEIEIDMPENLTTWKIAAWTVGPGLRVGEGAASIVASKDLIIRMQKPRFLTRGDEATLSAIVHNYTDETKTVKVGLEFAKDDANVNPDALKFVEEELTERTVDVPVNGHVRVDWVVKAVGIGDVALLMKALATGESDAIQETITVNEHGIEKQLAYSGYVPPLAEYRRRDIRGASWTFEIPEARRVDDAKLVVRVSPTLAGAILDAIPYLTEYPYGCTEQTLNRFLPAALAQKALRDLGVDLQTLKDKRANLNAQELGDPAERIARRDAKNSLDPIFDRKELNKLVAEGVKKLQSMQNADGGWGWFGGAGSVSSPRLTALVTRGLKLASECGHGVDTNVLTRGTQWLKNYERNETLKALRGRIWTDEQKEARNAWNKWKDGADETDAFVYYTLTELGENPIGFDESFIDYENADFATGKADFPLSLRIHAIMGELVWNAREKFQLYPLATYGITLTKRIASVPNDEDAYIRLETLLRVFKEYRVEDEENQTVWLDLNRRGGYCWWNWFGSEFETQAHFLRLIERTDRAILEKLGLEGDAPKLVKYLLNNRKNATYWNSTRDTAVCIEAFTEYLTKTGELKADQEVVVRFDDKTIGTFNFTPDNVFTLDGTAVAPTELLEPGLHTVSITVGGEGPLYCNGYYQFYSMEDPIGAAGLEVKASRNYYKLVENKTATAIVQGGRGQALEQRVEKYERAPIESEAELQSGDLVEVEILVESKNDYESIMIRDHKAAGMEPVNSRSGYRFENGVSSYVEFRDDAVCFFVENLRQGTTKFSYRLRAETPGLFSALPTTVEGMYAPELKGNSDEFKTKVVD